MGHDNWWSSATSKKKKRGQTRQNQFCVAFRSWRSAWVAINSPKACDNDRWHRQPNKERPESKSRHQIGHFIYFDHRVCALLIKNDRVSFVLVTAAQNSYFSLFCPAEIYFLLGRTFTHLLGTDKRVCYTKINQTVFFFTWGTIDTSNTLYKKLLKSIEGAYDTLVVIW